MKSVLMVSYWYPPTIGAAARRVAGFARYLPEHGWRPTVLTSGAPTDADGDGVIRVADFGPAPTATFPDYVWPQRPRRYRSLLRGWIFPDRFCLWRWRAFRAALARLRNSPPGVVWASFPPASAAVLGAALAQAFDVPFFLDFRDLWLGPGGYMPRTGWGRSRHERLERRVVAAARSITTVSDAMSEFIAARHSLPRDRIATIPNGFDAADCPLAEAAVAGVQQGSFILAHVGTVIERNRPDLFLGAIANSPHRDRWRAEGLRIRFVGNLSPAVTQRPEFTGLIETTGIIGHAHAWREMYGAAALLLLVGDYVGRWGHNAKVFEYLRSGRPILCLEETPHSNDRRLLESVARDRCVFASLSQSTEIESSLDRIRTIHASRDDVPAELRAFERRAQCARLAAILDAATPQRVGTR